MTKANAAENTLQHLETLANGGTLSTKVMAQANTLLQRAKAPVVIAVLGLPESGKSQLINMLVGEEILTGNTPWATAKIGYGTSERTIVTFKDDTSDVRDGLDLSVEELANPKDLKIEISDPKFRHIELVETALAVSPDEKHEIFDNAVQSADIILWCSQEFSEEEYVLWDRVPDSKKDHSFMILTKADLLSEQCVLSETIEQTQVAVAEEFHSLIPVATRQALKALQTADDNALQASGGAFLIKAIMDHAENGRRADMDNAEMFLQRHGGSLQKTDMKPATIAVEMASEEQAISAAVVYLQEQADIMARSETEIDERAAFVLNHCVSTSAHLAETIQETGSESPENQELVDDVMQAADVILLMQMEDGVSAAADAATVLLQLRRGFEAKIAA